MKDNSENGNFHSHILFLRSKYTGFGIWSTVQRCARNLRLHPWLKNKNLKKSITSTTVLLTGYWIRSSYSNNLTLIAIWPQTKRFSSPSTVGYKFTVCDLHQCRQPTAVQASVSPPSLLLCPPPPHRHRPWSWTNRYPRPHVRLAPVGRQG